MNTPDFQLSQALERIYLWFQVNARVVAGALQPGLTHEQISTQVQDLPFCLPQEVYQIYQWHNGSSAQQPVEFLPQYRFLSLEEALDRYQMTVEIWRQGVSETEQLQSWCPRPEGWFPLFAEDSNFYMVVGQPEPKTTAPIIHFSEYGDHGLVFNSLTDMMLAIAECLETGTYFLYEDINCYLDWRDDATEAEIWLKYQPQQAANVEAILNGQVEQLSPEARWGAYSDLVEIQHPQALSKLLEVLQNTELSDRSQRYQIIDLISHLRDSQAIRYLLNLLPNSDRETQNIVIEALVWKVQDKELIRELREPQVVDIVVQLLLKTFGSIWEEAVTLLGMLGDTRAVTPLLKVLQDSNPDDYSGRLAVIEALGLLEDQSAVEPIFQIIQQDKEPATILAGALLALRDTRIREILIQLAQTHTPTILVEAQKKLS